MSLVWRPLDTAPRLKRNGDTAWAYLWAGGQMAWERTSFDSSFRLQSGARQQYTLAGGARPWAFEYRADAMPARFAERLLTYFDWAKGTTSATPQVLVLQPRLREFSSYLTVDTQFTVHLVDSTLAPEPRRARCQTLLGYAVHLRFEEASPSG